MHKHQGIRAYISRRIYAVAGSCLHTKQPSVMLSPTIWVCGLGSLDQSQDIPSHLKARGCVGLHLYHRGLFCPFWVFIIEAISAAASYDMNLSVERPCVYID